MSGDYSVGGGASIPGQFINFTNQLNSAGTISSNTNTAIVTGVGTAFLSLFKADDIIYDGGGWVCGVAIGQIASIQSNTKLTLYENAAVTKAAGSKFCGPDAPGAFAAVNNCGLSNNITLTLNGAVNEPGTTSLKKWTETGTGGYKLTINCFWNNLIEGNNATGLIKLDGCSNVIINGGDPWGNYMTFRNNATTGADLVFINGAQNNTIDNCSFENRNTTVNAGPNMGAILFSTSTGPNGNSYNTINNCIIRDRSDITGTLAHHGICSQGTNAYPNSFNNITNCSFDNIENNGIWLTPTGNGDGWKIMGNIFYREITTGATTAQSGIYFNAPSSNANKITNNYIGRDGPPYFYGEWTNSGNVAFIGIYLNVGTTAVTKCDSNNVAHVRLTSTNSTNLYGIQVAGGLVDIKYNGIGDGYWLYVGPQDTYTLAGTGTLAGILVTGGTTVNIENNAIYALTKTNTAGTLIGIGVGTAALTTRITGNIVNSLTGSGSVAGVGNLSSVCGIYNYATNEGQYIYNNSISGLENTYVGNNVTSITAIALKGPATGNNICARNNIYLDGNCRNGATLKFGNLVGIDIQGAAYDIVNNMLMLGYDNFWYTNENPYIISGIKKSTLTYINHIYFNSIFVVGTSNSATVRNSYCYNALAGAGTADIIMNNIFFNGRTNTGNSGNHYAMFFNNANTFDYNDYFVTGTGGLLSNGNNFLPLRAGQDAHSLNTDPDFIEEHCQPCPWNNLHISSGCALNGKGFDLSANSPPYIEDYDGEPRNTGINRPDIGADEFALKAPLFTRHPKDTSNICGAADSVSFIVATAGGISVNYQWQVSTDGNTWINTTDGGTNPAYNGSNTPTLKVKGAPASLQFRCMADSCGEVSASNIAKLQIGGGAPVNLTLTATPSSPPHEGDNVIVKANVDSAFPATSYSWWKISNIIILDPNNTNTLTFNNVPYNGDGIRGAGVTWIMVRANNACGSSSSIFYFLNVVPKTIASNPSACGGNDGYIKFPGLIANNEYDITYNKDGVSQTPLILIADNNGELTMGNLADGTYTDIVLYLNRGCGGCTTNSAPADTIVLSGQTGGGITYFPPDKIKCSGDTAVFRVLSPGANLSYKWYYNGILITGATDRDYIIPVISPKNAGTYHCIVTNYCGTFTSKFSTLTVNSSPSSNIKFVKQTKYPGDNLSFSLSPGGTGPFSFQWIKNGIDINGETNSIFNINSVACQDSGVYSCKINNTCASITAKIVNLYILNCTRYKFAISGHVKYDNNDSSAMSSFTDNTITNVSLLNKDDTLIEKTETDDNGFYVITDIINGNYKLIANTSKKWGGCNPADALLVNRNYIGVKLITDPMKKLAADVNNDLKIDPKDALIINRRYIGIIDHFTNKNKVILPDWLFSNPAITIETDDITRNILAICAGDVNGSYSNIPPKNMNTPISTAGLLNIEAGKEFELPVYLNDFAELGALGIKFSVLSSQFSVLSIKSVIKGLIYNIIQSDKSDESEIRIAWSAENKGYKTTPDKPLFTLICSFNNSQFSILNRANELMNTFEFNSSVNNSQFLMLSSESVLADIDANLLSTDKITTPKLTYDLRLTTYDLKFSIYPNPFSSITNIDYSIPEDANVKLIVYNVLGEKIECLTNERKLAGQHSLQYNASALSDGIYYCVLQLTTKDLRLSKTNIMMIAR